MTLNTNGTNGNKLVSQAIESLRMAIDVRGDNNTLLHRAVALAEIALRGQGGEGTVSHNLRVRRGEHSGFLVEVISPDMAVFVLDEEVKKLVSALLGEANEQEASPDARTGGWACPTARALKWHYFPAGEKKSLCGKYLLLAGGRYPGNDNSPDNCLACRRKKLNTDEAEV